VRLLTIHQAKGLEFPVVILADAAYSRHRTSRSGIVERLSGQLELRLGAQHLRCATLGWQKAEAQEQERDAAEERRLWYVAATRVRDHLVIPVICSTGAKVKKMEHWAISEELALHLSSPSENVPDRYGSDCAGSEIFVYQLPGNALASAVPLPTLSSRLSQVEPRESALRDYQEWESVRLATLAAGRQAETITTVTTLSALDEQSSPPVNLQMMAQRKDRLASLRFDRAVHAALRSFNMGGQPLPLSLNFSETRDPEEREEITRLVMATLSSSIMLRAQKAKERFAETPFSLYLSGRLIEGVVDFAFIENGAWVIVDFKTDRIPTTELEARAVLYRPQLCLYALALERLTRRPIAELALCFVRLQRTVLLMWDDEARRLAETLIDSLPGSREAKE
jgi:ATP-dependent exoDNAse (exonuclease V) beta subunit